MPRLVDADKVADVIDWLNEYDFVLWNEVMKCIDKVPTVDAEPVRYGHWIENDNGTYSCSECHSWIPNEQHYYARYCLHCGAKMLTPLSKR